MPIDTRAKRLSMLNFGGEGVSQLLLPDVSGSFDQGDRQTFLDCYRGILFAGGAAGGGPRRLPLMGAGSWLLWLLRGM